MVMVTVPYLQKDSIASACVPKNGVAIFLPKNVIASIFRQIDDPVTLRRCSKVCTVFQAIALNEDFLNYLFPIRLPREMTIRQWLLQSIHSEKDLLKCLAHYINRATVAKGLSLHISTPSGAFLGVFLGGNRTIVEVLTSNDVVPAKPMRTKIPTVADLYCEGLACGRVRSVDVIEPHKLLYKVQSIYETSCHNHQLAIKQASERSARWWFW